MGEKINLERWKDILGSDKPIDLLTSFDYLKNKDVETITLTPNEFKKLLDSSKSKSSDDRDPERMSIH